MEDIFSCSGIQSEISLLHFHTHLSTPVQPWRNHGSAKSQFWEFGWDSRAKKKKSKSRASYGNDCIHLHYIVQQGLWKWYSSTGKEPCTVWRLSRFSCPRKCQRYGWRHSHTRTLGHTCIHIDLAVHASKIHHRCSSVQFSSRWYLCAREGR